jgi:hypothetical protein
VSENPDLGVAETVMASGFIGRIGVHDARPKPSKEFSDTP